MLIAHAILWCDKLHPCQRFECDPFAVLRLGRLTLQWCASGPIESLEADEVRGQPHCTDRHKYSCQSLSLDVTGWIRLTSLNVLVTVGSLCYLFYITFPSFSQIWSAQSYHNRAHCCNIHYIFGKGWANMCSPPKNAVSCSLKVRPWLTSGEDILCAAPLADLQASRWTSEGR